MQRVAHARLVWPVLSALYGQRRGVRYSSIQETLMPTSGVTAGQLSTMNDICSNEDAEEERRKPGFRLELVPHRRSPNETYGVATSGLYRSSSYLRTLYQWGFHSLTLFHKINEDPGPWWNANASTLTSTWSQIGDYGNAGMWSGIWRYTYGVGEYNVRPYEVRARAWGYKQRRSGALAIRYRDGAQGGRDMGPIQYLCFPHTAEHTRHHRIANPSLPGYAELTTMHGKRILREVQYHLGQGLRFYMVDGVLGSDPATATPYRIFTDNPTHAYFATMAAVRLHTFVAQDEITLVKRVRRAPMEEWAWRRPGVVVYHAPAYDFEAPRVVEEFGGPRPSDLGLRPALHDTDLPRFVALEPYSIPMKAVLGGVPECDALLDVTALLCARWGFYADEKGLLTLPSESVLCADRTRLTLVMTAHESDTAALRASDFVYGARHHRLAQNKVSRAWDVVSVPLHTPHVTVRAHDLVEHDLQRVHQPLPTRFGLPQSLSHRFFRRRRVGTQGYKYAHRYTDDVAAQAYAAGNLFTQPESARRLLGRNQRDARPACVPYGAVDLVVLHDGADAQTGDTAHDAVLDAMLTIMRNGAFLYAEEPALRAALGEMLRGLHSVRLLPRSAATTTALLQRLANGHTVDDAATAA